MRSTGWPYDDLSSTISGIPCRIRPTSVLIVPGSHSYHAASDMDYYGYTEIEFEVLDRRGYPAAWLERKMTEADRSRIETEITEYFTERQNEDRDEYYANNCNRIPSYRR